jgi:hypothetical protein
LNADPDGMIKYNCAHGNSHAVNRVREVGALAQGAAPAPFGSLSHAHHAVSARLAGGRTDSPISFGIGADPGHHEHRRPSTSVPTEASGWRSTVRRSMAVLVRQPGQNTSSHGVPASIAARIVVEQPCPNKGR